MWMEIFTTIPIGVRPLLSQVQCFSSMLWHSKSWLMLTAAMSVKLLYRSFGQTVALEGPAHPKVSSLLVALAA